MDTKVAEDKAGSEWSAGLEALRTQLAKTLTVDDSELNGLTETDRLYERQYISRLQDNASQLIDDITQQLDNTSLTTGQKSSIVRVISEISDISIRSGAYDPWVRNYNSRLRRFKTEKARYKRSLIQPSASQSSNLISHLADEYIRHTGKKYRGKASGFAKLLLPKINTVRSEMGWRTIASISSRDRRLLAAFVETQIARDKLEN